MNTIIKNHSSSKDLSLNLQVRYIIHWQDFLCTQGKMKLTTLLQQENLLIAKTVLQKRPHSFWTNWDVGKDECQELKKDGHLANPNSVLRKQAQHQHCSVVATARWEPFLSEHHPFGSQRHWKGCLNDLWILDIPEPWLLPTQHWQVFSWLLLSSAWTCSQGYAQAPLQEHAALRYPQN